MPNNQANSGSDLIPVTYNVTGVATTYFWETPQRLRMPEYFFKNVVTPTWAPFSVTGPSQVQQAQMATGTIGCHIVQANVPMTGGPFYCDIILSGVWWKVQGGVPVVLPQVIVDVINQSSTYRAVIP